MSDEWEGKWEAGKIGPMTEQEMVSEYEQTLKETTDHFGNKALYEVHGVFLKGTNIKVCITGISPNSPDIAAFIVGLQAELAQLREDLNKWKADALKSGHSAFEAMRMLKECEEREIVNPVVEALQKEVIDLRASFALKDAALDRLEWADAELGGYPPVCFGCEMTQSDGHKPDCWWQAARNTQP